MESPALVALLRQAMCALIPSFGDACREPVLPPVPDPRTGCSAGVVDAFAAGDEAAIRDLVARKADVSCGVTVRQLEIALEANRMPRVRMMLAAGVDPNASPGGCRTGNVLLRLAVERHLLAGHGVEAVRLLLRHGARPDQVQYYRWTWIRHRAGLPEHDTGTRDDGLRAATALMTAAVAGDVELARLLLQFGAVPALRDHEGRTALDHAWGAGHGGVVALLGAFDQMPGVAADESPAGSGGRGSATTRPRRRP